MSGTIPYFARMRTTINEWYRQPGKRVLDILAAGLLVVVLSPLLLILAILVHWQLGSPILFKQSRPGRHGRLFKLLKFRSMTDLRDRKGMLLSDEQRLTRFGRFMRSTSLDELPQLVNVLSGDMSLVGPRPLLSEYLNLYTPEQAIRQFVRPGMTGLAQVRGRNAISWKRKFRYDAYYVKALSLALDIEILFETIQRVVTRRGVSAPGHATTPPFAPENSELIRHDHAA